MDEYVDVVETILEERNFEEPFSEEDYQRAAYDELIKYLQKENKFS